MSRSLADILGKSQAVLNIEKRFKQRRAANKKKARKKQAESLKVEAQETPETPEVPEIPEAMTMESMREQIEKLGEPKASFPISVDGLKKIVASCNSGGFVKVRIGNIVYHPQLVVAKANGTLEFQLT